MAGEHLHNFQLQPLDYIRGNSCEHLVGRHFRRLLADEDLPDALLNYLDAEGGETSAPELVLSDEELRTLAEAVDGLKREWRSYAELHRRSIDCIAEIREYLAPAVAEQWAGVSARLTATLEQPDLLLCEGVAASARWLEEVRRVLKAMGAVQFLPAPEDSLPTPSCPSPPALPTSKAPAVEPKEQAGDGVLAAITEVRDLLLHQKQVRDHYSTEQAAEILGRANWTVREWCRLGRVNAEKWRSGRGRAQEWVISHAELLRIQKEGLLPTPKYGL